MNVVSFSSSAAFVAAGSGFGGAAPGVKGGMMARGVVQKKLSLNPELVGGRADALLHRRPSVQHVDDSAAVVEKRLQDLLEPRRDPQAVAARS